jgi:hypothetical protein
MALYAFSVLHTAQVERYALHRNYTYSSQNEMRYFEADAGGERMRIHGVFDKCSRRLQEGATLMQKAATPSETSSVFSCRCFEQSERIQCYQQ